MAYDVAIDATPDYIRVEVSGHRAPRTVAEEGLGVWSRVAETCKSNDIHRILAISRLTGSLSTVGAFRIGSSFEAVGLGRQSRIAFVDLDENSRGDTDFGGTVAFNRGYSIKQFDNESDALSWLLESDGEP